MAEYMESFSVEFKREVTADLINGVIAFANTNGGTMYIGVDDAGNIVGIDRSDDTMAQIGNMIRDGIKPDLTAYTSIEAVTECEKTIVRILIVKEKLNKQDTATIKKLINDIKNALQEEQL